MTETEAFAAELFKKLDRYFEYDTLVSDGLKKEWEEHFAYANEDRDIHKQAVLEIIQMALYDWRKSGRD